jgi:flavin reductase
MSPNRHGGLTAARRDAKVAGMTDATATQDDHIAPAFRQAMRRLTSTVCIATARLEGQPVGMTMTAVTSVSMEPPALLLCVNRQSRLHGALTPAAPFCVNILRVGHDGVAAAFGGRASHTERFGSGNWVVEDAAPPYLEDGLANLFCIVANRMDYGSHCIFIGCVREVRNGPDGPPLIYGDGRYGPN